MANKNIGACWACPSGAKRPGRDMHHVLPLEYGGPDSGKKVPLCRNCHDEVHSLARAMIKGERPAQPASTTEVAQLASYVLRQYNIYQEGGAVADEARNIVQFQCTTEEKAIAHDLKRRMGMRSLERMFKVLMLQEWDRRRRQK